MAYERFDEPIVPTIGVLRKLASQGECVVLCYNQAEVWQDRTMAAAFYAEGVRECDGCEAERYMNIVMDLIAGKAVCHDGVTQLLTRPTVYR